MDKFEELRLNVQAKNQAYLDAVSASNAADKAATLAQVISGEAWSDLQDAEKELLCYIKSAANGPAEQT